jgi:hypothetical protein
LHRMYHGHENIFRHTRWYFYLMLVEWKLISVHLEIVLLLTQYRCMVYTEYTIGPEIALSTTDDTPR